MSEFPKDPNRRSGRYPYCKPCHRERQAPGNARRQAILRADPVRLEAKRAAARDSYPSRYVTIRHTANQLRTHHPEMSVEDSLHWATQLRDPYTRCSICGLPERIRAAYKRKGWSTHPFMWRFSLDRIDPLGGYGDLTNIRVLDMRCNILRGPGMRTDAEVLRKVRRWYERRFTKEELWWLNPVPGSGGSPTKGRKHDRQVPPDPTQPDV